MNITTLISKILSDDNTTLNSARKVCHLEGLASIPFGINVNGGLDRAFFVYDYVGHLNVHNHKYDITLTLVQGHPVNIITDEKGIVHSKHLISKDPYFMKAAEYHTVLMSPGDVWIVNEGSGVINNDMITHRVSQPCVTTKNFDNNEEIINFLNDFKETYKQITVN